MAKLSQAERKKSATYFSGGKAHFPMPDKKHARLAVAMEEHAPPSERPKIEARARAMGVQVSRKSRTKR